MRQDAKSACTDDAADDEEPGVVVGAGDASYSEDGDEAAAPTFPPLSEATPEGLLAIGGALSTARLLTAYHRGIFPWFSEGQPVLWWSPDPRALLLPGGFKISRSLARVLRGRRFQITMDHDFRAVIHACAAVRQHIGTWIGRDMISAYSRLHDLGYAHSVEVWRGDDSAGDGASRNDGAAAGDRVSASNGDLVGGLYGVSLGRAFFGESMFSCQTDASKVALAYLVRQCEAWGFDFIDCQMTSAHLRSLGAVNVVRDDFINLLQRALQDPGRISSWRAQLSPWPRHD